jgi:hypothetical protein
LFRASERDPGYHGAAMTSGRKAVRRDGRPSRPWWIPLLASVVALAVLVFVELQVARQLIGQPSSPPLQPTVVVSLATDPIILSGSGSRTTDPFHLAGGTYRHDWSAWGERPEFPPCTHSAQLVAVDPANTATPAGVTELARLVHVPATGGSYQNRLHDLKPGDYYLDVNSECSWQISLIPE